MRRWNKPQKVPSRIYAFHPTREPLVRSERDKEGRDPGAPSLRSARPHPSSFTAGLESGGETRVHLTPNPTFYALHPKPYTPPETLNLQPRILQPL
jgi:hypothetical protein